MGEVLTSAIEAAVGVACLVGAAGIWRRSRLGIVVLLLGIAGIVAVLHAVVAVV